MKHRWSILTVAVLVAVAASSYAWLTTSQRSCAARGSAATTQVASSGAAKRSFDPVMSGMCRFSCATQAHYDERDVIAQPGAQEGRLTRCPVSGVVFIVAADRPHVSVANHAYVLCCDQCQSKFTRDPGRFVKL